MQIGVQVFKEGENRLLHATFKLKHSQGQMLSNGPK